MNITASSLHQVSTVHNSSHANNFNFLRLLLASLVLLAHGPEIADGNRSREILTQIFGTISFGEVAVNGFFLLSGYLIVISWERKPDLRDYFEKRVRRIFPGFIMACLVSVFVLAPFGIQDVAAYFSAINYSKLVATTLTLRQPEVSLIFPGQPHPYLNGALWSIEYEFRAYILVAVIGVLATRWQKHVWTTVLILCLALMPFPEIINSISFPGLGWVVVHRESFVRLFAFFSAGACFHLYHNQISLKWQWALVAVLLMVPLLFHQRLAMASLVVFGSYALFWFAFHQINWLTRFQRMDDISYGVYLYGWPLQKLLDWYFPTTSLWLLVIAAFVLSCLCGYASWHLVESRFLKRRLKAQKIPT